MDKNDDRRTDLGERELDLMEVLWELKEGSVADVQKSLRARDADLAYTTVQTMLNRLVDKGMLKREKEGRAFRYRPTIRQETVTRRSVQDLIARFFGGSTEALARHLVTESLEPREVEQLRRLIEEKSS